ncbi:MAG: GNAT family N-acetyltransferase [Kofleriaceae bacterium]|nr:GNAT family N-acetyltransferase [Kofleriaceae bacterium]
MSTLALPDLPRWVEAHGIAADPASWHRTLGPGFAVGSDRARLIVVGGDADATELDLLARAHPEHTFLVAIEREDLTATLHTHARAVTRAVLHTLPEPDALPELDGAAVLSPDVPLSHLSDALAEELAAMRTIRTVWAAWVDDEPVSFAYAPWRSAAWFDVSVDTAPGARQLGLATIVAAAMIRDERAQGREPVWGADEHNHASLRLAKRLGFEPFDELWVAPPAV